MTTTQILNKLMEQNAQILESISSLNARVSTLEKGSKTATTPKKSVSTSKTARNTKQTSKKSAPKQTREERLTEKFGDKESRTKWAKAKSEGFITIHEVMGHEKYYALKKNERAELASKFADLRVASPKKSAKTIAKEVLK